MLYMWYMINYAQLDDLTIYGELVLITVGLSH